jgi:argininosuccinate lyase
MMAGKKLWEKGYKPNREIEEFTVGDDYILDQKLLKYDCKASIAHARMLAKIGIITRADSEKLVKELENVSKLAERGEFTVEKEQEDSQTAIENWLTEKLGDLGKKLHTGRSRNDQVLTVMRLYEKDGLKECIQLAKSYIQALNAFIYKYGEIALPGYTHTRKAMPSSVKLWTGALVDSMQDNIRLMEGALCLIDQSPLGTGAGYGSPIKLDREYTAKELGFASVQQNPIYAQLSRGKFEATVLHALSQIMFDFNRMATDLILFSMPEFGYYELPDEFTTGSSMMPNKKNPDVLEMLRAKYHIVVSLESQVKCISSSLPTGYNRDMQLTKGPLIKGFEITKQGLKAASLLFRSLKVNKERCRKAMTEDIYATEKAYKLVEKGVPFRDAYKQVSKELSEKR